MVDFLSGLFGGGYEAEAAEKNRAQYGQFGRQATDVLKTGYDTGVTNLNKGLEAFQPLSTLSQQFQPGTKLYLDALGVNGPEAAKAAQSNFVTTPGYALSEAAGQDAINQRRALSGGFNSGATDMDAIKFGQNNLYQTQYQPWMAGLQGINQNNIATTGATAVGQAGQYGSLADLARMYSGDQTSVLSNVTSGMTNANNAEAAGKAAGSKNLMSAALGIGSMLLTGGASGFGGSPLVALGGSAGKMFMGGGSPSGY